MISRPLLLLFSLVLLVRIAPVVQAQSNEERTFKVIERDWRTKSADRIAASFAEELVLHVEGHRDNRRIGRGRATNILRQYFSSIQVTRFEIQRMQGSMCFYRHEYDHGGHRVRGSISVQLNGLGQITQIRD